MKLDDELIIETPERVELRYALASIGNRFLAAFIDHIIQALAIAAIFIGGGVISEWAMFSSIGVWTAALMVLGFFLVYWGYFVLFETIWNGQSPGKRLMRLRVIREDGRPVRFFEIFVRNLLRVIDFQPLPSYAIGVVSIILSPNSKRLGDFVAGTVVVKERATEAPSLQEIMKISQLESSRLEQASAAPFRIDFKRLSDKDLRVIETFLKRRYELPEPNRSSLAARIAASLSANLGIELAEMSPDTFIEEVDRQHKARPYWINSSKDPADLSRSRLH